MAKFLSLAIAALQEHHFCQVSSCPDQSQSHHVSVLFRGGKLLGLGYNSARSRYAKKNTVSLHAEVDALFHTKERKRLKILVIRIDRCGKLANSCPCLHCLRFLLSYGIKKISYSTGNANEIKTSRLEDLLKHPHISRGFRPYM